MRCTRFFTVMSTEIDLERLQVSLDTLDEARRRVGVRKIRRLRKLRNLISAKAYKVHRVKKIYRPWRTGAIYNRHR